MQRITSDSLQENCTGIICVTPVPNSSWFCQSDVLDYPARVTADPTMPPGRASDHLRELSSFMPP